MRRSIPPIRASVFVLVLTSLLLFKSHANAASANWLGATSGDFAVGTNWSTGNPPGSITINNNFDVATFNAVTPNQTVVIDSLRNVQAFLFNGSAGNYTFTGGTLVLTGTFQDGINNQFGSQTFNNSVIRPSLAGQFGFESVGNNLLTINSQVTGFTSGATTLSLFGATNRGVVNGVISNGTGVNVLSVSVTGSAGQVGGGWVVGGLNTYTGSTTVNGNQESLTAGSTQAFGVNSAVTVGNISTLNLAGFNNQIGSLTGTATSKVTLGSAILTTGGNNTSPGAYAGVVSDTGGVTKIGTGTQIFSGANTYSGNTTVSSGHLQIDAGIVAGTSSSTGTGFVAVSGGTTATLSGTGGTIGAVTVTNGSRLAPGDNTSGTNTNFGSAGMLTLGSTGGLTLTNARLDFDLSNAAASGNDTITTGGLTLGTLAFNFNGLNSALQTGTPYLLISDTGTTAGFNASNISTTYESSLASGGYTAAYSLSGQNLVVTFTAVPEPSTVSLMGMSLGGLALYLTRRSRSKSRLGSKA